MNKTDQPSNSDDLRPIDRALLLAISRIQRDGAPLSADQERLLDDWLAGRLSTAEANRAAELSKRNGFAAERILERRLVAAADTGAAVPPVLSSRILKAAHAAEPKSAKTFSFRWPILSGLQWSAAGAAVAATLALGVLGVVTWHENTQSYQRVQIAMVTIDDRRPLSGMPQYRSLRSDGTAAPVAEGYRDFDVPADLLQRVIDTSEGPDRARTASQLLAHFPQPSSGGASQAQIAINSVLADRLSGEWSGRMIVPVRAYDLDNARLSVIRENLKAQGGPNTMCSSPSGDKR